MGDPWSFSGLTSKIPPLSSILKFDADVKETTARHQCENRLKHQFHSAVRVVQLQSLCVRNRGIKVKKTDGSAAAGFAVHQDGHVFALRVVNIALLRATDQPSGERYTQKGLQSDTELPAPASCCHCEPGFLFVPAGPSTLM